MRYIFLALSALILAGCATNARDCDPTTGDVSIITKFNCNYSGTWISALKINKKRCNTIRN
jgi:hypothetical protein